PIHDPVYLADTMKSHFSYFGIFDRNSQLVAASSAETDKGNRAVEMTDFAVNPEFRGNGLALSLLDKMEESMTNRGMKTFFTIARLNSPAMNRTFLRMGYRYSGTLVRNTNISGQIESMNVLYKKSTET
ncbi:MAG TPA: GNAT family N-acetyltransferase, partial [Bacteroidales bacterium]|nr:GNAT family N-acetyltransferase [Bacteroidales bacterium]